MQFETKRQMKQLKTLENSGLQPRETRNAPLTAEQQKPHARLARLAGKRQKLNLNMVDVIDIDYDPSFAAKRSHRLPCCCTHQKNLKKRAKSMMGNLELMVILLLLFVSIGVPRMPPLLLFVEGTGTIDTNEVDVDGLVSSLSNNNATVPSTISLKPIRVTLCNTPLDQALESLSVDNLLAATTRHLNSFLGDAYQSFAIEFLDEQQISSCQKGDVTNGEDGDLFFRKLSTQPAQDGAMEDSVFSPILKSAAGNRQLINEIGTEIVFQITVDIIDGSSVTASQPIKEILLALNNNLYLEAIKSLSEDDAYFEQVVKASAQHASVADPIDSTTPSKENLEDPDTSNNTETVDTSNDPLDDGTTNIDPTDDSSGTSNPDDKSPETSDGMPLELGGGGGLQKVIIGASVAGVALAGFIVVLLLMKRRRRPNSGIKDTKVDLYDIEKGGEKHKVKKRKSLRDFGLARNCDNKSEYSGMDVDDDDDLTNTHTNVTDCLNVSESVDSKHIDMPSTPHSGSGATHVTAGSFPCAASSETNRRVKSASPKITPPRLVTKDLNNIPQFSPLLAVLHPKDNDETGAPFRVDFDHATFEDAGIMSSNTSLEQPQTQGHSRHKSDFTAVSRLSADEIAASWNTSSVPTKWNTNDPQAKAVDDPAAEATGDEAGRWQESESLSHQQEGGPIYNISSPERPSRDVDDHMSYVSSPGHSTLAFDTSASIFSRLDDGDSNVEPLSPGRLADGAFPQEGAPIYAFGQDNNNHYSTHPSSISPKMDSKSLSSLCFSTDQSSHLHPLDCSGGDVSTLGSISDVSGLEGKRIWDQYLAAENRQKKEHELLHKVGGHFPQPHNISSNASFSTGLSSTTCGSVGTGKSKQLMNDILWLEQKIADRTGSFATDDNNEVIGGHHHDRLHEPLSPSIQRIVCRDCFAPPGKLNIVIRSSMDGPVVHSVDDNSTLKGQLFKGDLIIAVDNVDTRSMRAEQVMKLMQSMIDMERKITILHFGENEE
jgi:hypothetical protein